MRIIKWGHACVRLEYDDHAIVIDPGAFTEFEAVEAATAVLITHEHLDHYDPDRLRATDCPVFTIEAVATKLRSDAPDIAERVRVVEPGESFDCGVPAEVIGRSHAEILPDLHYDNSGYLLNLGEKSVFHPGDALTVPERQVDLLCLPVSAPWLKISECVAFAREVAARRSLAIHDLVYSELGLAILDGHLKRILEPLEQDYVRLAAGEELADEPRL